MPPLCDRTMRKLRRTTFGSCHIVLRSVRERNNEGKKGSVWQGSGDESWELNSTKALNWPYQSVSHPQSKCFSLLVYLKSNSFFHRLHLMFWAITRFLYNILQEEWLNNYFICHCSELSVVIYYYCRVECTWQLTSAPKKKKGIVQILYGTTIVKILMNYYIVLLMDAREIKM